MADVIAILEQMRASSGHAETTGLTNDVILDFASRDNTLVQAIEEAGIRQGEFTSELLMMAEHDLVSHLQEDFVNFYAPATINPYVAVAARGPWIVTSHGAVVHDNGGYGMLGGGHGPEEIIDAMRDDDYELCWSEEKIRAFQDYIREMEVEEDYYDDLNRWAYEFGKIYTK